MSLNIATTHFVQHFRRVPEYRYHTFCGHLGRVPEYSYQTFCAVTSSNSTHTTRILPSSRLLRSVRWFDTDVSGVPVGPVFRLYGCWSFHLVRCLVPTFLNCLSVPFSAFMDVVIFPSFFGCPTCLLPVGLYSYTDQEMCVFISLNKCVHLHV